MRCSKCDVNKDKEDFHRSTRALSGRQSRCKLCVLADAKSPRRLEKQRGYGKTATAKLKLEVYTHYSSGLLKCNCCGEGVYAFLTLDHMNDDGAAHRKEKGWGTNIWRDLRKNDYPEGYQVLCYNCNCARAHNNGVCPHEEI